MAEPDTAVALGSGDVEVLATPRLLAWMEAATVEATADVLRPGETSVGTRVELDHQAASPVGSRVTVTAELGHRDGRLLRFSVGAHDASGRPSGTPPSPASSWTATASCARLARRCGRALPGSRAARPTPSSVRRGSPPRPLRPRWWCAGRRPRGR